MSLNFSTSMDASSGLQSLGKYKILGTLGRGSMGIVYKAQDPEIGRVVAIKTLRKVFAGAADDFPATLERFKFEARSAGNLRHPNVITVFDVNIEGDTPYIVMDYVDGETLDRIIARQGRLAPALALHYLAGVASGLDYAHSKGVIHRDVKPSNILVDSSQRVYLLDFGIARMNQSLTDSSSAESAGSSSEAILGSPGYMSPDQILNQQLDHRSDLFSLAVVTFEALCGQRPFPGDNFTAVVGSILNAKPLLAKELVPELPIALDAVFAKALARNREERFNSGYEFIEACREAVMIQGNLVAGPGGTAPSGAAGAGRRKRLSTWKSLPSLEESADVRKFPQININRNRSPDENDALSKDTSLPWVPDNGKRTADVPINPQGQHHRQKWAKPGDVFSSDGNVVYLGRGSAPSAGSALFRNLTMLFTLLCLFLGGILAWVVFQRPAEQTSTTMIAVDSAQPALNSPLLVDDLQMPRVAMAAAGKAIEEMEGPEVLGVLADSHASESNILNALREANSRKLPGLAEVISLVTINHDSYVVRIEAIKALAQLGDKRVVPRLVLSLDDYDPLVRGNAAKVLGELGSRAALSYLRSRHLKEDDNAVKQAMHSAIQKLEGIKAQ